MRSLEKNVMFDSDPTVPPSLQEQTNSISPCQSAALRETNLSTQTNRDGQREKVMQLDRDGAKEETGIDK
ncbi:BEACH domain containing protein lvsA [Dissostichus eleginoides]|uniref:BEACH domain containing protein lvsA n=1 Tax=Dissostichus eleginoides TaxID=100907 RepID=A0AAD9F1N6_DISEL|nr:BEACH domain containing protein lvsA [Dissostichus eleginoides]